MTTFIDELQYYPIKSARGVITPLINVSETSFGIDRSILIVDSQGNAVTARQKPGILSIQAELDQEERLKAIYSDNDRFEFGPLNPNQLSISVNVWGRSYEALDFGAEAATWISDILGSEGQRYRLVILIQYSETKTKNSAVSNFVDIAPVLLLSRASIEELNKRSPLEVNSSRFRANILVDGIEAHVEDSWKTIRIGDVILHSTGLCPRCVMTTINPNNGISDQNQEPIKSLMKYRQSSSGDILFGNYFRIENAGTICTRDSIEVIEYHKPEALAVKKEVTLPLENSNSLSSFTIRCWSIIQDNNEIKRFIFRTDEPTNLKFKPGQFAIFTQTITDEQVSRCYSLSSPIDKQGNFEISIKKIDTGKFSHWMHQRFEAGDTLQMQNVSGDYILHDTDKPILLMAAGSGITPNIAIARQLLNEKSSLDVVFLYTAKTKNDLAFINTLNDCQNHLPNFTLILNLTQDNDANVISERLNVHTLLTNVPDITRREVYYCGPPSYQDSTELILATLGVSKTQIHTECFSPATSTHNGGKENSVEHSIEFNNTEQTIESNSHTSILQSALSNGIQIAHACRLGACGSCAVQLLSGKVETRINGVHQFVGSTQDSTLNNGNGTHILACCSYPASDLLLDC